MNKKLFSKLGLLLLSLSLVSCGQKDTPSKSTTNQLANSTESSLEESVETSAPSVENTIESKQEDEAVEKDVQQESAEKEYYDLIKEAWQKQKDYIDSIDDPNVKQSLQTAHSAAIFKSNELLLEHPEDSEAINASLQKVLAGE